MIIDPYTWHRLPIQRLSIVAEDTVSLQVSRPASYRYQAGQYAVVRVTTEMGTVLRQYSFASSTANDFLEFLIQREPGGVASTWFHDHATSDDLVEISQPFGSFTLPAGDRPVLLIAGRVGIAPFISMARDGLVAGSERPLTILYSARGPAQFCYPDLLQSSGAVLFDTKAGERITGERLEQYITDSSLIYVCGSKQFTDGISHIVLEAGATPGQLRRELFTLQ